MLTCATTKFFFKSSATFKYAQGHSLAGYVLAEAVRGSRGCLQGVLKVCKAVGAIKHIQSSTKRWAPCSLEAAGLRKIAVTHFANAYARGY